MQISVLFKIQGQKENGCTYSAQMKIFPAKFGDMQGFKNKSKRGN